jgi:hypothetical protein
MTNSWYSTDLGTLQYDLLGNTPPIFVFPNPDFQTIRPGEYFRVTIHNAQAAFRGDIFRNVKQLIITSKVSIGDGEEYFALQRSRQVKPDEATQLGLASNLISLIPANIPNVGITIEFVLDTENQLEKLIPIINSSEFIAAISLAPGAAAVAKTVSSLASNVLKAFLPGDEGQPILEFSGHFNIAPDPEDRGLRDGYYVILGTKDDSTPLPTGSPSFRIDESKSLLIDGEKVTQYSYIILEVVRIPVKTRDLAQGAIWDAMLRNAENLANQFAIGPPATEEEKQDTWQKCKEILQEARTLLIADTTYAPGEANDIYLSAYKYCVDKLNLKPAEPIDSDKVGDYVKRVEEAKQIMAKRFPSPS